MEKNEMHLFDDVSGYTVSRYKKYAYLEDPSGTYMSLKGKKLKRVGRWSKQDEEDGIVHEADVNPEMKTLIDTYLDSDEVSSGHRLMVLDIEVSMTEGKPDVNIANNTITAISFYQSDIDKYTALILDTSGRIKPRHEDTVENILDDNKNVISSRRVATEIIPVKTEEHLLSKFITLYGKANPTIVTGWNIDFFDIPYLFRRLQNILGTDAACLLSPVGVVKWLDYRQRYKLAGVSCLDYLELYKKFTFSEEPTYNLNAISTKELKMGKIEYEGTLDNLFETDIEKYVEYNVNDVKLVKMIDDKLRFIELAQNVCHKGHVPYEEIYYSSKFIEGAMLVYMKKLNVIAPTNRNEYVKGEKFEGAFVKPPQRGKYLWVYDLDMTSLYPSVIMSLNISPETKVAKLDGWDAVEFNKGVEKTYTLTAGTKVSKMDNTQLKKLLDDNKVSISSHGVMYNLANKGIIPAILETWFAERVEYKNLMKKYGDSGNKKMYEYFKARQHVQKVLLNSFYGVLGLPSFRFYDLDNALSVTLTGQSIIQYSQKMANYYYNKEMGTNEDYVIYMDTDSNYISALPLIKYRYPTANLQNQDAMGMHVISIATEIQNFINGSFNLFAQKFLNISKHQFFIKQEMVASSGVFLGKKRYALKVILDNGVKVDKLEVKGIDTVRSDFPPAFRKFLKEVLMNVLDNVDKSIVDNKILTFKKNIRTLSLEEVAKPTGVNGVSEKTTHGKGQSHFSSSDSGFKNYVSGTSAHIKAAIMYNNLLEFYKLTDTFSEIKSGSKIRWVYLTQNEFGIDALAFKGYDDPNEIMDFIQTHINHEKMFNSIFREKLEDLYGALIWSLPTENQQILDTFFEL